MLEDYIQHTDHAGCQYWLVGKSDKESDALSDAKCCGTHRLRTYLCLRSRVVDDLSSKNASVFGEEPGQSFIETVGLINGIRIVEDKAIYDILLKMGQGEIFIE